MSAGGRKRGFVWLPKGRGPLPAILFNHGIVGGMDTFEKISDSPPRLRAERRYGDFVLWVFGFKVWGTPPGQTGGVYRIWGWRTLSVWQT